MRQADLAGPGPVAPSNKPGIADRVVRRAERPYLDERRVGRELIRDAVDARHFEGFFQRKPGQDAGKGAGHQRLTCAGRTDHHEVVPTGRRDLERTLGVFLSLDFGEVHGGRRGLFGVVISR